MGAGLGRRGRLTRRRRVILRWRGPRLGHVGRNAARKGGVHGGHRLLLALLRAAREQRGGSREQKNQCGEMASFAVHLSSLVVPHAGAPICDPTWRRCERQYRNRFVLIARRVPESVILA